MFLCYFIATICFSSSLVAAISSSAAFSSALEALNMVDVHYFISFVVSLPKEVAQVSQAVLDGFRLSTSESPKPLPVLRIDRASVTNYSTPVEICTYIKAPVHYVVSAFAKASLSKPFRHSMSEKIAIGSTSSELNDPGLVNCQDMIMMLFIVATCFCLIMQYGYLRRIASCAFRRWRRANVSSLLIMPARLYSASTELVSRDEIACAFSELRKSRRQALLSAKLSCYPLAEFRASSFDTPTQHHGSQMLLDFWTSYSADESILHAFFLDTVKLAMVQSTLIPKEKVQFSATSQTPL